MGDILQNEFYRKPQKNLKLNNIIIIGTGGHSAELDDYIAFGKKSIPGYNWNIVGYLDDNPDAYLKYKFTAPYLGSISQHTISNDCFYIMGIANLTYRKPIIERFLSQGGQFISYIHPTATISPSAVIGTGVVVGPMANIGPNAEIGDYTLINSRCSIGHDSTLGRFNFISPNVCFSGFTSIGDENLFGINSATIPGIKVGNRNKIMAGMVLANPVGDDEVVFYRFKEKVIAVTK
jgi:sugar O-acyltransferase (sialic acid O-acetyltransferase NeuD family)